MFVFDVTKIIEYSEYINFIFSVKSRFDSEKRVLFEGYGITTGALWNNSLKDYIFFRNKYRNLRQSVIADILNKFRSFLPKECLIYEFGSLAKFTDRIESDVDLTICYDEKKNDIFECAEELINYSITYIFEQSIDQIHGKFQHYPIVNNYDGLSEKDNLYVLKFDDGEIKYKCEPNKLTENLMNIKNVRDYSSLIEGYKEKYALKCNIDCLYSVQIIENSTKHNFIADLADLENQNDIFSNYRFDFEKYFFEDSIEVSYIKKAFKNTVVSMYIMISSLRKKVKWLKKYSMNMNDVFESKKLIELFGYSYVRSLKEAFIKMIFYWDKIELLFKKNGILLSTGCHKIFSRQDLNNILYEEYNEENLMDKILASINDMNIIILSGWKVIDEKYG